MKKKKMARALQDLTNRFELHVGGGDYEHMSADKDHNGFLTVKQLYKIIEAAGTRTKLPEGTDILKLEPGHYWGQKLVNTTWKDGTDGITLVDVQEIDDNCKQFVEIESVTGSVYRYTTHLNGAGQNYNAPSTWTAENRHALLWEGNVSAVGSKITLADNQWKYKKMLIFTSNQNGHVVGQEVIVQNNHLALQDINNYDTQPFMASYKMQLTFKDNTCTIDSNSLYIITGDKTNVASTINPLTIIRIEGIV